MIHRDMITVRIFFGDEERGVTPKVLIKSVHGTDYVGDLIPLDDTNVEVMLNGDREYQQFTKEWKHMFLQSEKEQVEVRWTEVVTVDNGLRIKLGLDKIVLA